MSRGSENQTQVQGAYKYIYIYIYIYIYTHSHIYLCVYIYIYIYNGQFRALDFGLSVAGPRAEPGRAETAARAATAGVGPAARGPPFFGGKTRRHSEDLCDSMILISPLYYNRCPFMYSTAGFAT